MPIKAVGSSDTIVCVAPTRPAKPSCHAAATLYLQKRGANSPYHKAVAEQQAVLTKHGSTINMDVLGEMETLHLNIQEALRMHPPLLLVMRYVKQPFQVTTSQGKTYDIPAVSFWQWVRLQGWCSRHIAYM